MQHRHRHSDGARRAPAASILTGPPVERRAPPARLGGIAAACRVLAEDGYRAIETLRPGDRVRTVLGHEVTWATIEQVGRRSVVLSRTSRANCPVRVRRSAIADGVPSCDVLLAPDHAIHLGGKLYRVGDLVNGGSILFEAHSQYAVYYGLVLRGHDILLAENLPIESLLPDSIFAFETPFGA